MNEEDVKKQIKQMVAFIKQEAEEKAGEILIKGEEEFNIEKARLLKVERQALDKEFEKKKKAVDTERRILQSNQKNNARLEALRAREGCVQSIFQAARSRLSARGKGPGYKGLLQNLILQGLLKLMEPKALINVREKDVALAKEVLPAALAAYRERMQSECQAKVDEKRFLPPAPEEVRSGEPYCCGGCVLSAHKGRIMLSNTLDSRLELAFQDQLPEIRIRLFGASVTRTHHD